MAPVETCMRCGAEMAWRHGTWQCPRCRLKLGCCEGEPLSSPPGPVTGSAATTGAARCRDPGDAA